MFLKSLFGSKTDSKNLVLLLFIIKIDVDLLKKVVFMEMILCVFV